MVFVLFTSDLHQFEWIFFPFCRFLLFKHLVTFVLLNDEIEKILQITKRLNLLIPFGECNGSIEDIFVNLLRRQLFSKESIMLFELFLDLSLFGYFVPVFCNPFGNFGTSTDSMIWDHFDGKVDNFDAGLLNDEEDFSFLFGCECILFDTLLDSDDLRYHVLITFGAVTFVPNKTSLDEIIKLSVV